LLRLPRPPPRACEHRGRAHAVREGARGGVPAEPGQDRRRGAPRGRSYGLNPGMSYDLYIVPARPGLTPAEVGEALERAELEDTDRPFGVPPEAFRACLDEILRRHPPMEGMSDEEIDRSIWSIDPGCEG